LEIEYFSFSKKKKMEIIAYTDGSCNPKTQEGGWGAVILKENQQIDLFGIKNNTTNNRMELTGVVVVLKYFKEHNDFHFFTDSKYVIGCATNEYKIKINTDLWKKYKKYSKNKNIKFTWVRGHNGDKYNEQADVLANKWREN